MDSGINTHAAVANAHHTPGRTQAQVQAQIDSHQADTDAHHQPGGGGGVAQATLDAHAADADAHHTPTPAGISHTELVDEINARVEGFAQHGSGIGIPADSLSSNIVDSRILANDAVGQHQLRWAGNATNGFLRVTGTTTDELDQRLVTTDDIDGVFTNLLSTLLLNVSIAGNVITITRGNQSTFTITLPETTDTETTSGIIDATGGLPQPTLALVGTVAIDLNTLKLYVCINRPEHTTAQVGTFADIPARDNFEIVFDRTTTAAIVNEFIWSVHGEHFFVGTTVAPGRVEWLGDTADDALAGSLVNSANDVHFLGPQPSDAAALALIPSLLADTEYFYVRAVAGELDTIRRLDNTTYTAAGGVIAHPRWAPIEAASDDAKADIDLQNVSDSLTDAQKTTVRGRLGISESATNGSDPVGPLIAHITSDLDDYTSLTSQQQPALNKLGPWHVETGAPAGVVVNADDGRNLDMPRIRPTNVTGGEVIGLVFRCMIYPFISTTKRLLQLEHRHDRHEQRPARTDQRRR